jgi:glycosyltransferase involved in cell wall biosynthesis
MSSRDPKVSVLMPVYNGGRYLLPAVRSILEQTYPNLELILVDDCSDDGAIEQVKSLGDPRIVIHRNIERSGVPKSLNSGLSRCTGEYVLRMDADDISLPNRIRVQVDYLERNLDVGILGTNLMSIDANGRLIRGPWFSPSLPNSVAWSMLFHNPLAHATVAIRRSFITTHGIRYSEDALHTHIEDYELWLRCLYRTRVERIGAICLHYRLHPSSVSSAHRQQQEHRTALLSMTSIEHLVAYPISLRVAQLLRSQEYEASTHNPPLMLEALALLNDLYRAFQQHPAVCVKDRLAADYDFTARLVTMLCATAPKSGHLSWQVTKSLGSVPLRSMLANPFRFLRSRLAWYKQYRRVRSETATAAPQ